MLVIYKGDAGYVSLEDRANLDQFLRRGGGIISLHDALCADDTGYFANIVGGAKKHGETNFTLEANVPYTIVDKAHPIMKGMEDFKITDEAFFLMTWSKTPEIHVLATAVIDGTPSAGHPQGRGRAADVDVREVARAGAGRLAVSRVRLDAGAQLLELRAAATSSR